MIRTKRDIPLDLFMCCLLTCFLVVTVYTFGTLIEEQRDHERRLLKLEGRDGR